MYRIRLHGRGGQGVKTAGRILGTAFFLEGFEIQDAPRYGAERRGAPISAYVRADRAPISERGSIRRPDLVVVADDTLVSVGAAGVLAGIGPETVLLIHSGETPDTWRERLQVAGPVVTLAPEAEAALELRFVGALCAGAAARLIGAIGKSSLERAIHDELSEIGERDQAVSVARALRAWDAMETWEACVNEGARFEADPADRPSWIELPLDSADVAAPDIHRAATSLQVRTGLWRTVRPVIDYEHCNRCSWICSTFCPDAAIAVEPDRTPVIDYDHCKGCMICATVCPPHAIRAVPEREAAADEASP
jgi:pyruvate ferredoxin oxidoreductase gamma subunit